MSLNANYSRSLLTMLLLTSWGAAFEPSKQAGYFHPRVGTELFVDDTMIQKATGVKRTLHQATKLEKPVLEGAPSGGKSIVHLYGTIYRDEKTGKFRMWYSEGGLAYAESDDGIKWVRPELNYTIKNGKPANILLSGSNLCFVIDDPKEPDKAKRFKALDNTGHNNFVGFYSADGLEWQPYEKKPLVPYGSEISNGVKDPKTGRYFLYFRPYLPRFYPKNEKEKRLVAVTTSSDFVNWTEPKIIIRPDEIDDEWVSDEVQRTEFYAMSGFPYGNHYLGLLPVFRITEIKEKNQPGQSRYEGPIDAQLVTSRDGLNWDRTKERKPVIATGPHAYDAGCIMNIASTPVIVGDEIYYYYTALSSTHGATAPPKRHSIALAKWRLDGFVSMDASSEPGMIQTQPVHVNGERMQLNANVKQGKLTVELLDESGTVLPGYSASDCHPINGDSVRHEVRWGDKLGLPQGARVRLRFAFDNGSLYSYTIVPDGK